MDEELRAIEEKLENFSPAAMPDEMLARMESAMNRWQESVPVEEKVVPFQAVPEEKKRLKFFNAWASAAAVALVAAASFMVLNDGGNQVDQLADLPAQIQEVAPSQNIGHVVPASNTKFERQVTGASDGVITYDAKGRPMRVMRVGYEDEVTMRGRDGKEYKIKQPRVEYYAVPLEIH